VKFSLIAMIFIGTAQIVIKKDLFLVGKARNGITVQNETTIKIIPFYDPKTLLKMPLF
jgi:hypothetical protein